MKSASFYKSMDNGTVLCELCPHRCLIKNMQKGRCGTRKNENGILSLLNYGQVCATNIDPMEKKPLYHFLPGTEVLSFGNNGCNFQCAFCQNWQISQTDVPTRFFSPEQLVFSAKSQNIHSVAFTYAEPTIWYEYIYDCARLLKAQNIHTVLVSNGFINSEPLEKLLPYISAMNIDIKSMEDEFYQRLCKGSVFPVLDSCRMAARKIHLEITNLVIPGENDNDDLFHSLGQFIAEELAPTIPLHLSRYHPSYQMDHQPTDIESLIRAQAITKKYLHYVFVGNVWSNAISNDSVCPNCDTILISRTGIRRRECYSTVTNEGHCRHCGFQTGIFVHHD